MSGPAYLGNPHDHPIWEELSDELHRAMTKFGPMASPHEGWAVIREELEPELWAHVVGNTGRSPEARQEALQVAAMAIRYILDLCEPADSPLGHGTPVPEEATLPSGDARVAAL